MKKKKIIWGVFFLLAAVFLVVGKLGFGPDIGLFSVLMTIFFIGLLIEGIRSVNFYEILFSIAFLYIIYDEPLGIANAALTPWTVLLAALLASIGLSMIFRGKRKSSWGSSESWGDGSGSSGEQCSGEHIRCENNFGSAIRYINSDNFCNAQIENNFGEMSVYFDNAMIQGDSAYVEVENNFGETNLYIPREWKVENCLDHSFGTIGVKGKCEGTSQAVLYVRGSANFGAINIYYI